ncbi:MAG: ABC transporter permease, partial [Pseudoalteromonas spongiae]
MLDDILYAVRGMLKNPRFAALTTFVMTIGLSLCIYMFSFIFNTLSGTIPLEDGERLRKVTTVVNGVAYDGTSVRYQEYLDIVNQQTSFEFLDAYD